MAPPATLPAPGPLLEQSYVESGSTDKPRPPPDGKDQRERDGDPAASNCETPLAVLKKREASLPDSQPF